MHKYVQHIHIQWTKIMVNRSFSNFRQHTKQILCLLMLAFVTSTMSSASVYAASEIPTFDPQEWHVSKAITDTVRKEIAGNAIIQCGVLMGGDLTVLTGVEDNDIARRAWVYLNNTAKESSGQFDGNIRVPIPGISEGDTDSFIECQLVGDGSLASIIGQGDFIPNRIISAVSDDDQCYSTQKDACTNGDINNTDVLVDAKDADPSLSIKQALQRKSYKNVQVRTGYLSTLIKSTPGKTAFSGDAGQYIIDYYVLSQQCGEVKQDGNGAGDFNIPKWDEDQQKYVLVKDGYMEYSDGADKRVYVSSRAANTCRQIVGSLNGHAQGYVDAMNECQADESCEGRSAMPGDDESVMPSTSSGSSADEEDPCEAGFLGFGWIFCPGQNLLTQLIDGLMGIVADSMEWRLLADQAGSNGPSIQDVWIDFLNIANILFAIAFLVMIYSMATSTGLSNYDVKKMLPRLIVVAIAVNISFYICAALVDISNIAGGSMYDLFYGKTTPGVDFGTVLGNAVNSILGIVAGVLALFIFGGAAAVAVLVVVVCLAFRQIALVILIAISPIAMALYLLPNTERWAKQWFNMFVRLLIIYPAFTAVWGASRLISNIFATTGSSGIPGFIIDLACAIAPAVALPSLFKMSGGIMSFAAGAVAGSAFAKKTSSAVGSVSRNNAITRRATGFAGKRIGNFAQQHTRADSWIGSRLRHYAGAATTHSNGRASNLAYANAFDKQLDDQASLLVSNMDVATRKSVALTGDDGNGQVDWRVRKAAIEQSDDLDSAELEQLIVNTTNTANTLSKNNQNTGAQALRDTVYSKVKDNSAYMGDKEFAVKMHNGVIGSNVQQEYDASVISNASDMSKSTLSKTSADSQSYMYNKLKSAQEAGLNIDNAVNALRNTGEQLTNDSKTMSNMSASARSALTGINTLRTETEAKAAEALNLDGIAAGLNSTNETIRQQAQSDLARIRSERTNPGSDVYRSYNNLSPYDRLSL